MSNWGMYIIYALIVYAFIVFARQNRDILRGLIMSIIVANVISLDTIGKGYATGFIQIFLYEVILFVITFIVMKVLEAFSTMNMKMGLFIIEVAASIGLVCLYVYMNSILITLI